MIRRKFFVLLNTCYICVLCLCVCVCVFYVISIRQQLILRGAYIKKLFNRRILKWVEYKRTFRKKILFNCTKKERE